tara:strand:+ start:2985 stop:3512 length:528 start_codon:yes stop_codon:yes gene_type:complete
MKKTILSRKTTKYLLIVLLIVFIFGIFYYFMSNLNNKTGKTLVDKEMPLTEEYPLSPPPNIIEGFNSSNMGYNQTKMIVIYTASWCPHCRSFMGMQDKESPIGEDSEFSKTKNELGDCFEHVMDTDPNCSKRMQTHGINGYPGIAFVDKTSDVGVPLTTNRTAEDICAKFKALSS